jgi:hypothetical protein
MKAHKMEFLISDCLGYADSSESSSNPIKIDYQLNMNGGHWFGRTSQKMSDIEQQIAFVLGYYKL